MDEDAGYRAAVQLRRDLHGIAMEAVTATNAWLHSLERARDQAERVRSIPGDKLGKKEADARVERSLYQKAVGYSYDSVKIFMRAGAKAPIYAPYVEHIPPSDVAAIFWLKNRDPANWRDAWQIEGPSRGQVHHQRQADDC